MTGAADSAGVPWAGRTLSPSGFEGDDGTADRGLETALRSYARGDVDLAGVALAVADARLLVPVVAVLGEAEETSTTGPGGSHLTGDAGADMALVTLKSPDGRVALPVFTSVDAMRHWDAGARPVPVAARRAALSAVQEGCSLLVVDPTGPVTAVLPRPAVWAVAQGRRWTPAPQDPEVTADVTAAVATVDGVVRTRVERGERAELRVVLTVRPGLDRGALDALTADVSQRLSRSDVVAERVDSLELKVVAG